MAVVSRVGHNGCLAVYAVLRGDAGPAHAWTWLKTTFDANGNPNCGTSSSLPCIMWQEPPNTSITIHAYMDPSIQSPQWDQAIQLGFNSFNGAPAWNPYMQECLTAGCGPVTYKKGPIDCMFYAQTDHNLSASFNTGSYWKAYITGGKVTFGSHVSWNTQLIWATWSDLNPPCTGLKADIRVVSAHETGHVQGLGHTGHSPAIMRTGPLNYWTIQSDDVAGLQYIYG